MDEKKQDNGFQPEDFLEEDPLLLDEPVSDMPELTLDDVPAFSDIPDLSGEENPAEEDAPFSDAEEESDEPENFPDEPPLPTLLDDDLLIEEFNPEEEPDEDYSGEDIPLVYDEELADLLDEEEASDSDKGWDAPEEEDPEPTPPEDAQEETGETSAPPRRRMPRKGRPKRRKGYGLLGIPHLIATVVWLAIILAIGSSLGRMIWVCAADVLAFGRESSQVSVTITSNHTIADIAQELHKAGLVKYPGLFKLYASIAVDDGDILPGTYQMDTLYDYHALVVQMGPRSSNRAVVEDVLIPEGLNCRQVFELLESLEICTVKELEEYAANGEFSDFWFLEGVERGDKYCLEGFLFPDTYDFYAHSTPREALGKMLLGFEARFTQEIYDQLPALNERLSAMMRAKGCSEEHIANNQLDLRGLLIVASLIEEETASSKESPMIASVIFNRLTEDQVYERYLGIDAALIYATGDANNIDTSIDHPYNTYKNAGLTPGPISNPGLSSILAALNFESSDYYYYVLNPETQTHQFSKTREEHEKWVNQFYPKSEG